MVACACTQVYPCMHTCTRCRGWTMRCSRIGGCRAVASRGRCCRKRRDRLCMHSSADRFNKKRGPYFSFGYYLRFTCMIRLACQAAARSSVEDPFGVLSDKPQALFNRPNDGRRPPPPPPPPTTTTTTTTAAAATTTTTTTRTLVVGALRNGFSVPALPSRQGWPLRV